MREGDHTHDAWLVRVVHESLPSHSLPMIVKAVPSQVAMAVELACGLAARELRLTVPQPGLVVAQREDLPSIDDAIKGQTILLVGSHYQRPDALFAQAIDTNPAAEELVWSKLCDSPVAREGAALDELIANPDRHCENVLFDGTTWWLFDHDQALAPAAQYTARPEQEDQRKVAIEYRASVNQLVNELTRRSKQHQQILDQIKRVDGGSKRLQALARYAANWTHEDEKIAHVFQLTGIVIGLIGLRMPTLGEKLHSRLGLTPNNGLWA